MSLEDQPQVALSDEQPDVTQAGYSFLRELGISAHLGDIVLDGGRPGCEGILAAYVGTPEHTGVREKITQTVDRAIARGENAEDALTNKLDFVIKRDEEDHIVMRQKQATPAETQEAEKK